MLYTFIAYRRNAEDSIRGCSMGRSESDFFMFSHTDPNIIADKWFWIMQEEYKNKNDRAYAEWDLYVLLNGEGENYPLSRQYTGSFDPKIYRIYICAKDRFSEWVNKTEESARLIKEKKESEELERVRSHEMAQLKQLQEKYQTEIGTLNDNNESPEV